MSKKLLSVLSAILLILNTAFLLPVSSAAAEKDIAETGVTAKNITLTATDGTKVSAVPKPPSKITVLVFGYPGCQYTRHFLIDLSASDLVNNPNYHFIYADIAGNSQSAVSSFQTRFSDQITFCYGDNSPILDKLFEDCTGVPAFVYIDTDGAVRLTEEGYGSLSSIEYRLHSIEGEDSPSGDEDHISWTLNGTELTLSGTGDMRGYDSSGSNAAPWGKDITKVTISDGITGIGEYVFYGCSGLKSVSIPNSVTSIKECAFYGCRELSELSVPDSVTNVSRSSFLWTAWYDHQPSGPVYAGRVVCGYKDDGSATVKIKDGTVGIGDFAFYQCAALESVTIPDSVTHIGAAAFDGCSGLVDITLPEKTADIDISAFARCKNLRSIRIPDAVETIENYLFFRCDKLKSVTMGNHVTSIGEGAFTECVSLSDITLPESVTEIGDDAFNGCKSLKSINIPKGVRGIDYSAFNGCSSIRSLTIGSIIERYELWMIFDDCYDSITKITITDDVGSIGSHAFSDCTKLTDITIPDSVKSIHLSAFYGCENLKKITIPNSVTEIGDYAFYGCESLKSITVPESVSHIGEYALGFTYGDVPLDNFVIYGYQRSKAERYTAEQNLTFIALDAEREVLLGDADQDGKVSVMDATAIQKCLASIPVKSCHEKAADADEDGSITILDATSIQKHLAKLPSNSHIGNPIGK